MAAHYAISASEDDGVIRQRLLTRTTTTRGEPPLKKLLKKFIPFASEVAKDADNYADCEKLYKGFVQELSTFELPLIKTKAVIDANKREQESFKKLQAELSKQITQVGCPCFSLLND
jgi:THO complex subunit 7